MPPPANKLYFLLYPQGWEEYLFTALDETTSHTPTKIKPHPIASSEAKIVSLSPPSPGCYLPAPWLPRGSLSRTPNCSHISYITKAEIGLKPLVKEAAPPRGGPEWGAELWFAHVQLPFGKCPQIHEEVTWERKGQGETIRLPSSP